MTLTPPAHALSLKVQSADQATGRVVMMAADVGLREFTFDGVVAQPASGLAASNKQQEQCYSLMAKVSELLGRCGCVRGDMHVRCSHNPAPPPCLLSHSSVWW